MGREAPDLRSLELPVIPALVWRPLAAWIDSGMRGGVPREAWSQVVTLYEEGRPLRDFLGDRGGNTAIVVLLDETGVVRWCERAGVPAWSCTSGRARRSCPGTRLALDRTQGLEPCAGVVGVERRTWRKASAAPGEGAARRSTARLARAAQRLLGAGRRGACHTPGRRAPPRSRPPDPAAADRRSDRGPAGSRPRESSLSSAPRTSGASSARPANPVSTSHSAPREQVEDAFVLLFFAEQAGGGLAGDGRGGQRLAVLAQMREDARRAGLRSPCSSERPRNSTRSTTPNGSSRPPQRDLVRRTPLTTASSRPSVCEKRLTMRSASPSGRDESTTARVLR